MSLPSLNDYFQHSQIAYAQLDSGLSIVWANEALARLAGAEADSLNGQPLQRMLPGCAHTRLNEALEQEAVRSYTVTGMPGSDRTFQCVIDPLFEADTLAGFLLAVHPLQGHEPRLTLQSSEPERLRLHIQRIPLGVIGWNTRFEVTDWNPAAERIFGYRRDEAMGREGIGMIVPEQEREEVMAVWQRLLDGEAEVRSRNHNLTRDGQVITCDWFNTLLIDEEENILGVASVVEDVSEQVEMEQALRTSEAYNRMLFDTSPIGLALCDMQGKLLDINQAYANIIGRSIEEAKGLSYWDVTPKDYAEQEQEVLAKLERDGFYGPYEKEYLHRDGSRVPVRLRGQIISRDGERYIWSSVEDITEKKRADEAMQHSWIELEETVQRRTEEYQQAQAEAEQASRAKSEFLSRMSHELRTPMNAILGFGQLLEQNIYGNLNEEELEYVHEISNGGNHLLELINEILDLSRIEAGRMQLKIEDVQVAKIVHQCLSLIRPLAEQENIDIQVEGEQALMVHADAMRLKQTVLNLLSNAIKYNRPGGKVAIKWGDDGSGYVRLSVSDTGRGIEADKRRVFEPFDRLDAAHEGIEGTGIGLSLAKRLTEYMGGRIDFDSVLDEGSTFWLELPRAEGGELPGETATEEAVEDARYNVLYVEDNPANLRLVQQLVSKRPGVRLLTAHNSTLAMDLITTNHFDLVLLDIHLGDEDDGNGYIILERLRSNPVTRDWPVVAISANATAHDIQQGLDAGFDSYLTKPLDIQEFFAVIDSYLPK